MMMEYVEIQTETGILNASGSFVRVTPANLADASRDRSFSARVTVTRFAKWGLAKNGSPRD
jgi:hypothetical protein